MDQVRARWSPPRRRSVTACLCAGPQTARPGMSGHTVPFKVMRAGHVDDRVAPRSDAARAAVLALRATNAACHGAHVGEEKVVKFAVRAVAQRDRYCVLWETLKSGQRFDSHKAHTSAPSTRRRSAEALAGETGLLRVHLLVAPRGLTARGGAADDSPSPTASCAIQPSRGSRLPRPPG